MALDSNYSMNKLVRKGLMGNAWLCIGPLPNAYPERGSRYILGQIPAMW